MRTGTSTRGPITAANACPESIPKIATATAIEVVGRRRKAQGGGLFVCGPHLEGHEERHKEHNDEIDSERDGYTQDIHGKLNDDIPFEGEHDHNGKEKECEGQGTQFRQQLLPVPLFTLKAQADEPGQDSGDERYPQIYEDRLGDLGHGDVHGQAFETKPPGQHCYKQPGIKGEENDLKDGVKGHQAGTIFPVPGGQVVPDDNHGYAPGKADKDDTHHVLLVTGQESDGKAEHEDRAHYPVLDQRQHQNLAAPENFIEFLISYFGQGRIHHEDEPDSDGDVGGSHLERINQLFGCGDKVPDEHARSHGQEYPQGQVAIEKTQTPFLCCFQTQLLSADSEDPSAKIKSMLPYAGTESTGNNVIDAASGSPPLTRRRLVSYSLVVTLVSSGPPEPA